MFFDPYYFFFLAPAILLAAWAQWRVKAAYHRAQQVPCGSGLSGAEAAAQILHAQGIDDVRIETARGFLGDHYDPRSRTLRLSPEVYKSRSLAAVGIAAHEAGHAIQQAENYSPLVVRNGIVPLASLGSNLSWGLILGGFVLGSIGLIWAGIGLFSLVVLFQLVNLPVEYNASSRAKEALVRYGIVRGSEEGVVRSVLSAAALTYVAATLTAILTLLYYLMRAGVFGGRNN